MSACLASTGNTASHARQSASFCCSIPGTMSLQRVASRAAATLRLSLCCRDRRAEPSPTGLLAFNFQHSEPSLLMQGNPAPLNNIEQGHPTEAHKLDKHEARSNIFCEGNPLKFVDRSNVGMASLAGACISHAGQQTLDFASVLPKPAVSRSSCLRMGCLNSASASMPGSTRQ